MSDIETAINYLGDNETAYFSSNEKKWVKRIFELKEKYDQEVTIRVMPKDNDGCICACVPKSWFKISPPRKIELSDEERQRRTERARMARSCKTR